MWRKKSGKILLVYILVLAMLSGTFSYMGSSTVKKASAKSKIPVSTIRVGQKIRIYLTANGKRVKNSKIKWASKNKKIAKISKKGVVTGVKEGTTKIYGKYKGVKYWRKIVVKKKEDHTDTGYRCERHDTGTCSCDIRTETGIFRYTRLYKGFLA